MSWTNQLTKLGQRARGEALRGLGLATLLSGQGPAARRPWEHALLKWAGVLERLPASWDDPGVLAPMPWGAGRYEAPAAQPPAGFDGMWPQPPLVHPDFCAPVLHLDPQERRQHRRYNVLRYLGQAAALTPARSLRALRGPRLIPIDDARFGEILTQTSLAQFINPTLDAADRRIFAALIGEQERPDLAKIDASAVEPRYALPGIYVAPTITLLARGRDGGYRPLAIHIDGRVVRPEDSGAWELARYFVLQGLQYLMVLVFHPRLHFPNDAINAITRTLLPQGHVLFKLLLPHLEFALGLHEAVIHHRRSVLHNSQREVYTPFPVRTEGIHDGVVKGLRGLPGNSSYRPYRFGPLLPGTHTPYGRYRHDWYEAVLSFVAQVARRIPKGDPWVVAWADQISEWLPGFPRGAEIFQDGVLEAAAASFITSVSVFHSGDHHSYADIPLEVMPWRLRRPPAPVQAPLDLQSLVSPEDFLRHQICHAMFFKPFVIRSLRETRHPFLDPELRAIRRSFDEEMAGLDARWRGAGFPSAAEISSSLQY